MILSRKLTGGGGGRGEGEGVKFKPKSMGCFSLTRKEPLLTRVSRRHKIAETGSFWRLLGEFHDAGRKGAIQYQAPNKTRIEGVQN